MTMFTKLSPLMMAKLLRTKALFRILLLLLLSQTLVFSQFDYRISNSNFTLSQQDYTQNSQAHYLYNYNRFRFLGEHSKGKYFSLASLDAVNYLGHNYVASNTFKSVKTIQSDTPFSTQSLFHDYYEGSYYAKIYRLYTGYEDDDKRIVFGLQNISLGVGHIWTPSNLFNPRNSYALEVDEIFPVLALSYTRHLSDTSGLTVVSSQKANYEMKYAFNYKKSFLSFADVGINVINSDTTKMYGYEIEANLADTGIEIRSEGIYLETQLTTALAQEQEHFYQLLLGADYGFKNGLTLSMESLFSSQTFSDSQRALNTSQASINNLVNAKLSLATAVNYDFKLYLQGSLLYIESFNGIKNRFVSPVLTYTLNDHHAFSLGAMIYHRPESGYEPELTHNLYLNYRLSF